MNSDIIKLLPDSVANQIAAGEVIQRPASVIKELVENSIDAGATSIQIIIKDAGRTLIQVVDNGKGMTPTDARMAFERHATSKITSADDLYTLHTMGFRGEALPSIAAVAQIELRTMPTGESIGCRLRISESKFESMEPATCVAGTNIMVRNLFFHMPARRKFLKKDSVELSHILHEFERLALVNTDVEFTIIHNDVTLHQLLPGSLKQRITALFGKAIGSQIIPVGTETSMVKISGFVGLPQHARRRNIPQYFFVNGRNMRHPYFHKAVLSCYTELIAADVQPVYFINFEVDPATIDVNIHPQKHEIKFENEQPIWQILTAAVKQALGKVNAAGAIDFDSTDDIPDIPVFMPDKDSPSPGIETDPAYNPFGNDDIVVPSSISTRPGHTVEQRFDNSPRTPKTASVQRDWDKLYESFASRRDMPADPVPAEDMFVPSSIGTTRPAGDMPALFDTDDPLADFISLDNKYIALPARAGLLLVNRYRAHVRVLYDDFMGRLSSAPLPSQRLIFPESLSLEPSLSAILSSVTPLTARLGYDISFIGDNTWAINAVPALPGNFNPAESLSRIVSDIADTGELPENALLHPAALSLARSAAMNQATAMNHNETDALLSALFSSPEPSYTPDGLKIIHTLSYNEIQHLFD